MITAQSLVGAEQAADFFGHFGQRRILPRHHVRIEFRRPAHRLAGVVDDEIQAVAGLAQMPAKRLHARRVPQIEPENLQPVAPFGKVRFLRVARRRIARKTRRHNQMRPGPEQFDAGLIADFDAAAGEQRHAPAQIRQLGPLAKVQFRAVRTDLVVKMVEGRIILFADVTILRLDDFAEVGIAGDLPRLEIGRWRQVGRGEHLFAPQFPDARLRQHSLGTLQPVGLAAARGGFHQPPARAHVRTINLTRGREQAHAFLLGQFHQQRPVARDGLQQFRHRPQLLGQGGVVRLPVGNDFGMGGLGRHMFRC